MTAYEYGTIHFPPTTFKKLRTALRKAVNDLKAQRYEEAAEVYERLCQKGKGRRSFNWRAEAVKLLRYERPMSFDEQVKMHGTPDPKQWDPKLAGKKVHVNADPEGWVMRSMFPDGRDKPLKPKKKDFSPLKANDLLGLVTVKAGPIRLILNEEASAVQFRAEADNKTELDLLRKHSLGEVFFSWLGSVKRWGSGGGKVYRCDGEYVADVFGKVR